MAPPCPLGVAGAARSPPPPAGPPRNLERRAGSWRADRSSGRARTDSGRPPLAPASECLRPLNNPRPLVCLDNWLHFWPIQSEWRSSGASAPDTMRLARESCRGARSQVRLAASNVNGPARLGRAARRSPLAARCATKAGEF